MSEVLVVIVQFSTVVGRRDEALEVLRPVIEQIQAEEGCLLYALHEGDEGDFTFIQKWASKSDADRHGQSSPVQPILAEKLGPLVQGPPVITELQPIPVSSKGTL
ncbi:putative quinol monooxygenase [Arthrobacter sp. CAL618]|uniref:putative quinol monooxygenase n=1 Tax=Arthrobacter sp. CAL618 TaxID=1055770 RepID=UPI0004674427|nr:putative quinol monooxygenase [Arthrobacter sp. CAL618]